MPRRAARVRASGLVEADRVLATGVGRRGLPRACLSGDIGGRALAEQEEPKVVMRGPDEGDKIVLPMGQHLAHITRKAARTETGGHWALGEAWQDPGFDNPPHAHDEAEAFYVLEGDVHLLYRLRPGRRRRTGDIRVHSSRCRPWISNRCRRRATTLLWPSS